MENLKQLENKITELAKALNKNGYDDTPNDIINNIIDNLQQQINELN